MIGIGVQTKNVVNDNHPKEGFAMLKQAGFSCADFSLNGYLLNESLYQSDLNDFLINRYRSWSNFLCLISRELPPPELQ